MTNAQVIALIYGLLGSLVVGAVILVPQILVQRARHGVVDARRVAITGAFISYACLALAVVLLPLPGPNTPPLEQTVQLAPLQWVDDIGEEMAKYGLAPTMLNAVSTQTFQQAMLNVLLFVPLGVFVRRMWGRGMLGALAIGLGVSLAIEITQLTANFGTAPFVYRIFDVDDMLTNTVGALVGWMLAASWQALRRGSVEAGPRSPAHLPMPARTLTARHAG